MIMNHDPNQDDYQLPVIGQLSKLPSNWPVTDCHGDNVMLGLSAD